MRIGVNTGKVFTGDFGPPYRRAYRVFGDAINTAARVMTKAEAGQILSTEIVLDRSRTVFETTPIPPFAAKGKAEPVRASIVGPVDRHRRHERTAARRSSAATPSCATLLDAVETGPGRARPGSSRSMGEPGIGKTRLLDEVVARAPDFRVLRVALRGVRAIDAVLRDAGDHPRSALGLDPDADAGRGRSPRARDGRRAPSSPTLVPWIPLLGRPARPRPAADARDAALDERFLRERLAEVDQHVPADGARCPGPTMLAIDDGHHLDEATPRPARAASSAPRPTPRARWSSSPARSDELDRRTTPDRDRPPARLELEPLDAEAPLQSSSSSRPRTSRCGRTRPRDRPTGRAATRCSCSSCSTPSARPGRSSRCRTRSRR